MRACEGHNFHFNGSEIPSLDKTDEENRIRVAELWLPSHSENDVDTAYQFMSSLSVPIALEFLGSGIGRTMLVRAPETMMKVIASKVHSFWPRAYLKILEEDPAESDPNIDSHSVNTSFYLASSPYLPIRIWDNFHQGDPIHGLLSSFLDLRENEHIWLQILILEKGLPQWLGHLQRRLKYEDRRGFIVSTNGSGASGTSFIRHTPVMENIDPASGFTFLGVIILCLILAILVVQGSWLAVIIGAPVLIASAGLAWRFLDPPDNPWQGADLSLVRQKVVEQDVFFEVAIRAEARAASPTRCMELLQRLQAQMDQFAVAGGNRLVLRDGSLADNEHRTEDPNSRSGQCMWLGNKELASLWHPPTVSDRISPGLMPVRAVEERAPTPRDVRGIYRIGSVFHPNGSTQPVCISQAALERNILLVGKPGTGKTNLMTHLALAGAQDSDRPAVVVVDPHGDMVERIVGVIDPADKNRVVIMDVGDEEFALTLNPLDPHRPGWNVESVANSIVDIGQALWTDYWGPRMQNVLKRGVELLAAVNARRMPEDLLGLSLLATVLNINHESRRHFIENELKESPYYIQLSRWFYQYYKSLTPYTRETIIQSVLYKAHRFEEKPLLHLFSPPRSALDLRDVLEGRKLLIVNTRMSRQGPELSSFVGSLIINMLLRELARQGESREANRNPVMLIIDEFQTFTGVPWQELLAQMRKYGGRVVIGTQSLASLRQDSNGQLPGIITSGIHSLFAFLVNGEDADYLTKYEFGRDKGGPGAETLTNLEPFRAYARILREDGTVAHPFYFETAHPPEFDAALAEEVRAMRAEYSVPYETAVREARERLVYLDRYASTQLSEGSGSMRSSAPISILKESSARSAMLETDEGLLCVGAEVRRMIGSAWASEGSGDSSSRDEEDIRAEESSADELLANDGVVEDPDGIEALFDANEDAEPEDGEAADGVWA